MFERLHMPPFTGAAEWLNSEPLGPAELRGHVVLVNFWTLTCINWLRQEPYVRAWSQAYRDDGLVVIGVHTPEFSFEHQIDRVRDAIKTREIDYPVAVDNDYAIWSAFDNHYWPALYFVDEEGIIRDQQFGEGRYEQSERVIQRLLGVERELVSVEGRWRRGGGRLGPPADARDISRLRARRAALTPDDAAAFGRTRHLQLPDRLPSTTGRSPVSGRSGARTSSLTRPAAASPSGSTRATRISCCPPGTREPIPFRVLLEGEVPGESQASTSTRKETACSATVACISWCANTTQSTSRRWKSRSSNAAPRRTRSRSGSQAVTERGWSRRFRRELQ